MRKFSLYLLAFLLMITVACQRNSSKISENLPAGMHAATVIEAKQAANYSYFKVLENDKKFWMATSILDAKAGDVIYYTKSFEMKDFKSKELNKTFESIMFVEDASLTAEPPKPVSPGKANPTKVNDLQIAKAPGGITIEELYKNLEKYSGKQVSIRGMIVKYNRDIMKKNWAHIQDGTSSDKGYDLTVTTSDSLSEGKIAIFTGTIELNKDFGYGYVYDVIMQDAKSSQVEDRNQGI